MDVTQVFQIISAILGIIAILAGVSWVSIMKKIAKIKTDIQYLSETYKIAAEDNDLSNEEKAKLLDGFLLILKDAVDILGAFSNALQKTRKSLIEMQLVKALGRPCVNTYKDRNTNT